MVQVFMLIALNFVKRKEGKSGMRWTRTFDK